MTLKNFEKFEEKLTFHLKNDMRNLRSFDPSSQKLMSLRFTEELCVMIMKNDTKIEDELTCRFKIDVRNLTNSDPSA